MITEFIPYELAVKLKELGFEANCLTFYNYDKKIEFNDDWACMPDYESKRDRNECLAPLWQQAFDWFREKHNIYCGIIDYFGGTRIHIESNKKNYPIEMDFNTNIGAKEFCLQKLIEIVSK